MGKIDLLRASLEQGRGLLRWADAMMPEVE